MNFTGEVRFGIWGTAPAPQGSKSVTKKGIMFEANKNLKPWREIMVAHMKATVGPDWEPWSGPVQAVGIFYMPKPRTTRFPVPMGKPDLDKLQRAVGDALTQARIISDDARIVHWNVQKQWALDGGPGLHLVLRQIGGL
ncbi:RusA family crossover junction endodeoxyribonuclease [Arthrobacter sp. HY1533]|uniref:RusA family crossover junction endodeoxyribonuclease n=1 Tax=Arthrobacter sp. HY1533 TaxID=2970919 RepID=UPI0022B9E46D|nr:RusA family crossover junction endodeoxyribonuclease [Arthrobacter sp. HY1533]